MKLAITLSVFGYALAGAGFCQAAELVLVEEGVARCSIVTGEAASEQALQAARDLQHYLERLSGAAIPLVARDGEATGVRLLVGQAAAKKAAEGMELSIPTGLTHMFKEEGYVVDVQGNTVVLAGNETEPYEGTWYAVYDLLEQFGCRWYMPGAFGEVVPKRRTLTIDEQSRLVRPVFPVRDVWYSGYSKAPERGQEDLNVWKRRAKMVKREFWVNCALPEARFLQSPVDNSTYRLLPRETYWETHPEYYALKENGQRDDHFICMSHPEGVQAATNTVIDFFKNHPDFHSFAYSPPDAPVLCHCEPCRLAMNKGFGSEGYGDVSDPFFNMTFAIADQLARVRPDRWIINMAYYNRCRPPQGVYEKRDNILIKLASIQQCRRHSYGDPDCWSFEEFGAMMRHWSELVAGLVYYYYDPHDWTGLYGPVWRSQGIAADLRYLNELGGWGFSNEGQCAWLSTGLNYYLRAKLAWDLELDVEKIKGEFFQDFFGPAAGPMGSYYNGVEEMRRAGRASWVHFLKDLEEWFAILPRDFLDRCADWLTEAQGLAIEEPYRQRVAAFRSHFDRLDAAERAWRAEAACDYPAMAKWGRRMIKATDSAGDTGLLQDSWERFTSWYCGKSIVARAEEMLQWTNGGRGTLIARVSPSALFRTDAASEGVVQRWYRPDLETSKWRPISVSTRWSTAGYLTEEGRPYEGIAWYRARLELPASPEGQTRLLIPNWKGKTVWVWCNGRFAGMQEKVRKENTLIDLSGLLQSGDNLLVFRIEGDGGLAGMPFVFKPAS